MEPVITYNQGDIRWRDKRLGSGVDAEGRPYTMGRYGCYVTTVASILAGTYKKMSPFGARPLTPGDLCDLLNAQPGGFDDGAQLGWDALRKIFPDVFIYGRVWTTNAAYPNVAKVTVDKCVRDLRRAVLLGFTPGVCVDLVGNDKIPDHIVAVRSLPDDIELMTIMDPDGGREIQFRERYGSPLKGIMGYRLLIGDAPEKPYTDGMKVQVDASFLNSLAVAAWKAGQMYQGVGIDTYKKEILDSIMGG